LHACRIYNKPNILRKRIFERKPGELEGPVEILTNFLQDAGANFWKPDNSKLCLCEASWDNERQESTY
jgi:hypothetical protein